MNSQLCHWGCAMPRQPFKVDEACVIYMGYVVQDKYFVHLDDVLVGLVGKTVEEHASNLREVLTRLSLWLKPGS